jgi:hypothetical protein
MLMLGGQAAQTPATLLIENEKAGGTKEINSLGETVLDGYVLKRRLTLTWRFQTQAQAVALDALLASGAFFTLSYQEAGLDSLTCYTEKKSLTVAPGRAEFKAVLMER